MSNIIIPSNTNDITKLKQMINAAVDCMARIDSENEAKKEIIDEIVEQFEVPKKLVNKAIRTQHKLNFSEQATEAEDFELLYETLYGPLDEEEKHK